MLSAIEHNEREYDIRHFNKYSETLLKLMYEKKCKTKPGKFESKIPNNYLVESWLILLQYGFKKFRPLRYGYEYDNITTYMSELYDCLYFKNKEYEEDDKFIHYSNDKIEDIHINLDDTEYLTVNDFNILNAFLERQKSIINKCLISTEEFKTKESYESLKSILKKINKLSKNEESLFTYNYLKFE